MTVTIRSTVLAAGLLGTALLAGCSEVSSDPAPEASPVGEEPPVISVPTASPGASIIRPDVTSEPVVDPAPDPLALTLAFPKGADLTPEAERQLAGLLESPALGEGWPVVLRGHSDNDGSSATINIATSRRRAQAVADWLVDHGVDEARIEVVALGAQNPAAPNANADGTPSEAGRARNRRVDITVAPPPGEAAPAAPEEGRGPTVAERLSRD